MFTKKSLLKTAMEQLHPQTKNPQTKVYGVGGTKGIQATGKVKQGGTSNKKMNQGATNFNLQGTGSFNSRPVSVVKSKKLPKIKVKR